MVAVGVIVASAATLSRRSPGHHESTVVVQEIAAVRKHKGSGRYDCYHAVVECPDFHTFGVEDQ